MTSNHYSIDNFYLKIHKKYGTYFPMRCFEVRCFHSIFEVGKVEQGFNQGVKCLPDRVWPLKVGYREGYCDSPGHLWRPPGAFIHMPSNVSCIKMSQKHPASFSETSSKNVLYPFAGLAINNT